MNPEIINQKNDQRRITRSAESALPSSLKEAQKCSLVHRIHCAEINIISDPRICQSRCQGIPGRFYLRLEMICHAQDKIVIAALHSGITVPGAEAAA